MFYSKSFKTVCFSALTVLFLITLNLQVIGKPVLEKDVLKLVKGWLKVSRRPLGATLKGDINEVKAFKDDAGKTIYYVVNLKEGGYIVVSADDNIEPIIAFSAKGKFNADKNNTLYGMLEKDMSSRLKYIEKQQKKLKGDKKLYSSDKRIKKIHDKWSTFISYADKDGMILMGSIDDPRVDPLIQSKWDQDNVGGLACFNYYTPTGYKIWHEGDSDNYPCGCVATCIGQLMRYYEYPKEGVGTGEFTVEVDGKNEKRSLRGGDGQGGAYDWGKMSLNLSTDASEENRKAIGALVYDIGVSVNMSYSENWSGAYFDEAVSAFLHTFKYSNIIQGRDQDEYDEYNSLYGGLLYDMVNTNLDAGMPVLFAVYHSQNSGGHAIVCDGYGYIASTMYHHLNMGWSGDEDDWYNLPNIGDYFDTVAECLYNIYIDGKGEIISGRVTDDSGNPLMGISVTAISGDQIYSSITNERGIYALTKLPSKKKYTLHCVDNEKTLSVGTSYSDSTECANFWKQNFTVSKALGYSSDTFDESDRNDGSIDNKVTIRLYQESFTADAINLVSVSNLPEGLNAEFDMVNDTEMTMTLLGQAINHYHDSDDIKNLTVTFADGAFAGNDASIIGDSEKDNFKINFLVNTYSLSYIAGDNGSISGAENQTVEYSYDGDSVEAIPDEGYHFVQWSDGVKDASRIDTNITEDKTFSAEFAINVYSLTYTASDGGTISGEVEQQVEFANDGLSVEAVPDTGYHFIDWSDGLEDTLRTDVNVDEDIDVIANFEIDTYKLVYNAGENGSLSGQAVQYVDYNLDAEEIEAIPEEGYHFVDWSDGVTDNPRQDIALTSDLEVTANFAINTYTLEYSAEANGSLIGELNQTVDYGTDSTAVEAVPDDGYHFAQWSDGSKENPRIESNVKDNVNVTAIFETGGYALSYSVQNSTGGELTGELSQTLQHGEDASLVEAIPDTGYHFVQWTDGVTDNPRQDLSVKSDIDVEAVFELDTFSVTYETDGHGSVSGKSVQTVQYGHDATEVTAVPDTDYIFSNWSDGFTEITRHDLNITDDLTVTANFKLQTFSVSGNVSGDKKDGVIIQIDDEHSSVTDISGNYTIENLPNHKTFTLKASCPGYILSPAYQTVTINSANLKDVNFSTLVNNPPSANEDVYSTAVNEELNVSAEEGVLANDTDIENSTLTAVLDEDVQDGKLVLKSNGGFIYTPPEDFVGEVSFTYLASDGVSESEAVEVIIDVTYRKITIGSIVSVSPDMVDGLDEKASFDKAPKIYGMINGKALTLKKDKSSTSKLAKGIWKKKYPLLGKIKSGFANAVNGKNQAITVQLAVQGVVNGSKMNGNAQKVLLVAPEVKSVELKGNYITIKGNYFGLKAPKVALEPKSGGKLIKCKVDKKAYNFNANTAESVLRASFKPEKVPNGEYWLVIDNKIGIGVEKKNGENTLPELVIGQ